MKSIKFNSHHITDFIQGSAGITEPSIAIFSSYNSDLLLKTRGSEKVRVKWENGFVGIGTNEPKEKLQIGNSGFQFHDGGHKVIWFNPNTNNVGGIRYDTGNKKITFETTIDGVYKDHMNISSNGNITVNSKLGIGTSTPDALYISYTIWTSRFPPMMIGHLA